ncbi:MAG: hypothetical protein ABSC94_05435 [Polyangiaceae bacterium]|jgi:hypothetical protein
MSRDACRFLVVGAAAVQIACFSNSSSSASSAAQVADATVDGEGTGALDGGAPNVGTVTISKDGGVPISSVAFGQNYWDWVDWAGTGVTGLTGTQSLVSSLHLNLIRAGGNNNDTNSPSPFDNGQIDQFVAYCRDAGAEPILQVPLVANNVDGGAATPQNAADIVTYANVMMGYGVRYWEIGNEPDLYATDYDASFPIQTASDYCTAFQAYVAAMKAANAAGPDGGTPIQFLGPELSYKYIPGADWLTPFLDACKDYVDVVTIHRYPFSGTATSQTGALTDDRSFQTTLRSVMAIVQGHARPNTPLGVTESNISYAYALSSYTQTSLLAAPGTFYAAIWTADDMGVALENGLWTLAFWNIGETSPMSSVLGFIQGGQPSPSFYAEQMVSGKLSGTMLSPIGVPSGYSVYASYDAVALSTHVLVINKTMTPGSLTLSIESLSAQSFEFPPLSITTIQLPDVGDGAPPSVTQYSAALAAANQGPQVVQ